MTWHAAFFTSRPDKFYQVYQQLHITEISSRCNLYPELITPQNIDLHLHKLKKNKLYFFNMGDVYTERNAA